MKINLYHNDVWFDVFTIDKTLTMYNTLEQVLTNFHGGKWLLINWNTYSNGVIKAKIKDIQ